MANQKISALTSASTPLAGTETLPVVQSSTTKQVSVANLTAGRAVSALSIATTTGATFATTSGAVGIGNASPSYPLDVSGTQIRLQNSGGAFAGEINLIAAFGNVSTQTIQAIVPGGATNLLLKTGVVDAMLLEYTGVITMGAYGAGAATFSASGVISSVSDENWKIKDGVPTNTDAMLQKLEPGYWFYNEEKAPIYGQERQLGFYAQNVREAIGEEAAPTPGTYKDKDGNDVTKPWGYYDRSVLAVTVMSLKNALSTIEDLKQRITALENKFV